MQGKGVCRNGLSYLGRNDFLGFPFTLFSYVCMSMMTDGLNDIPGWGLVRGSRYRFLSFPFLFIRLPGSTISKYMVS